jgi:putative Mg2+ transporter-C (MgtC) family protein
MLGIFTLNIVVALLMGLAIGAERQLTQHPAGLRTNALVCVGAALFVSLSLLMDHEASPTRIAAQVVSGIGFLGGGVILREGLNVKGMTTAATLWCSGAVGTLAGAGHVIEALIGTATILVANFCLRPVSRWIDTHTKGQTEVETNYRLRVICDDREEGVVRTILMRHVNSHPSMLIHAISTQAAEQSGKMAILAEIYSTMRDDRAMQDVVSRINIEPGTTSCSWERLR